MEILTFTTLYPNREMRRHGLFVRERLVNLIASHPVSAHVVAPVPWFPWAGSWFGRYGRFSRVPLEEVAQEGAILHPRFFTVPKLGGLFNPISIARTSLREIAARKDWRPLLLDAHYAFPDGAAAAVLAEKLGIPLVLTVRGSDINVLPGQAVANRWIRWTLSRCSAVIAVSQDLAEKTIQLAPDCENRITVITNGVDRSRFRPMTDRESIRSRLGWHGKIILCVGNLVRLKGHELVIRALSDLPGIQLVIVGSGPLERELRSIARQTGVLDRTSFLGSVDQDRLAKLYNAADVTVLPSSSEGMPNVVLESLASGTPVVASDIANLRSLIGNAGGVAARTPKAIANAVCSTLSKRPNRSEVSKRVEGFDWESRAHQIFDAFSKVIAEAA